MAGVQADQDRAFGGGLNHDLETPQGQLATSAAAIIAAKNSEIANLANQVDPANAAGRMQDGIGRIYFIERKAGTPTVVMASCGGLEGTVIPLGARAQDTDGNLYLCTQPGTIPASGCIDLPFACSVHGPTPCAPGALNQIYQALPGWESITNANAGTPGSDVESRADFEVRRRESVAKNGQSLVGSIYANIMSIDGVTDAYVTENPTSASVTTGGYTLLPNSLYVAVIGGTADEIARAIWKKKSLGCNYNGTTSYTIQDIENYQPPYPAYTVKWVTPSALAVKFNVQIASNPIMPADIMPRVKQAIISAFNGADGGSRVRIGSTVYASRFYAPISNISDAVSILSLTLGSSTPSGTSLFIPINRRPVVSEADITVTIV